MTYYTALPISIAGTEVFATSAGGSDNIALAALGAYGVKTSTTYNTAPVEGSLSLAFYWVSDMFSTFTDMIRKTETMEIEVGNTTIHGYLTDFSVNMHAENAAEASAGFRVNGVVGVSSASSMTPPDSIDPALGGRSYLEVDGSTVARINSVSYQFNQSFNMHQYLGRSTRAVAWSDGSQEITIDGLDLATMDGGICPDPDKKTEIFLRDCDSNDLGSINIDAGFTESRSYDVTPGGLLSASHTLKKFF